MSNHSSSDRGGETSSVISPTPAAVVVDTNLWGNGILDVGRLEMHAKRLARTRIEVWVPEQVLWEWASHAVKDVKVAVPIWNRLKRAGLAEGKFPGTDDVESVLSTLTEKVAAVANVMVVPVTGDAAVAGLRDQVLSTGAGTLRDGVKTGAVDSSLVRDALARAGGDAGKVMFVSNNVKDFNKAAKAMGVTVHVRSEDALYSSLFEPVAEPEWLVELIVGELDELTDPDPVAHPPYLQESLLPVSDIDVPRAVFDRPEHFELTNTSLAYGASIVAITNLEVVDGLVKGWADQTNRAHQAVRAGGSAADPTDAALLAQESKDEGKDKAGGVTEPPSWTVEFTLVLLADIDATGYELDSNGAVSASAGVIVDTVVLAPMVADVVGRSVSVSANGSARAEKSNPSFADPYEALGWALAELSGFHGVHLVDDDTDLKEFVFRGPNDVSVTATLTGSEGWKLTFDLGDPNAEAIISCHYDPDARTWGGRHSFYFRGPYYVVSGEESGVTGPNAYYVMTDVWRHLNGL